MQRILLECFKFLVKIRQKALPSKLNHTRITDSSNECLSKGGNDEKSFPCGGGGFLGICNPDHKLYEDNVDDVYGTPRKNFFDGNVTLENDNSIFGPPLPDENDSIYGSDNGDGENYDLLVAQHREEVNKRYNKVY